VRVLKGDLTTTPLPAVLRSLAADAVTGCLRVEGEDGDARVYLRSGKVYAVVLPGRPPRLGASLVASGELSPADLAEASEAQRTELQGWRLGELLVHLGYVEQPVVEAVVSAQLRESAAELALWPTGRWTFRTAERTREDVAPAVPVEDLLAEVDRRRAELDALAPLIGGADAVPVLSAAGTAPETQQLDPQAWSLLCAVDGERSVAALAAAGGLSLHEAGALVARLVEAGLVEVEPATAAEVADITYDDGDTDSWAQVHVLADAAAPSTPAEPAALAGPAGIAARLAEALKGLGSAPAAMAPTLMPGEDDHRALDAHVDDEQVETSVERASEHLAAALGPATGELELFPVDGAVRHADVIPLDAKQAERRARDAAELAARQAELEAARAAEAAAAERADAELLAEEQADAARERHRQSAVIQAEAFAELSAAAGSAAPAAVAVDEAHDAEPAPVDGVVEPVDEPAHPPRGADTAALLRELSSLGFDDEPAPAPVPQPRPTAATSTVAAKKRKGLFSRS
jgi:hypothetical protein